MECSRRGIRPSRALRPAHRHARPRRDVERLGELRAVGASLRAHRTAPPWHGRGHRRHAGGLPRGRVRARRRDRPEARAHVHALHRVVRARAARKWHRRALAVAGQRHWQSQARRVRRGRRWARAVRPRQRSTRADRRVRGHARLASRPQPCPPGAGARARGICERHRQRRAPGAHPRRLQRRPRLRRDADARRPVKDGRAGPRLLRRVGCRLGGWTWAHVLAPQPARGGSPAAGSPHRLRAVGLAARGERVIPCVARCSAPPVSMASTPPTTSR